MKNNKRWSKIALTALALAAVIGTAGIIYASGGDPHAVEAAGHAAEAAGEAHGASSMTGPHGALSPAKLKDFGWRVMNFAALLVILIKFVKHYLL